MHHVPFIALCRSSCLHSFVCFLFAQSAYRGNNNFPFSLNGRVGINSFSGGRIVHFAKPIVFSSDDVGFVSLISCSRHSFLFVNISGWLMGKGFLCCMKGYKELKSI